MRKNKQKQLKPLLILLALSLLVGIFYLFPMGETFLPYILGLRLKKLLTYILVAIITSLSTITFQTITGNRFLTPSVLGLESFYVLLQSAFFFVYWRWIDQQVPNSLIEFILVLLLQLGFFAILQAWFKKLLTRGFGTILLICMSLGTLFRSLSTYLQVAMAPNEYDKLQGRLFASLQNVNSNILSLAVFLVIILAILLYRQAGVLNVFYLGKTNAKLLGVDVEQVQHHLLWLIVTLTAISTAMVGPMNFFGFMVVNLVYYLFRYYEHSWLFTMSSLLAFFILTLGQFLVERVFNYQIPLSVLVELVGGVFFFYLLYKERLKS